MAHTSVAGAVKRPVTMGVVAAVVAVLVLFVGYLAYSNFVAPPKAAPMTKEAKAHEDRLTRLAHESGGDLSKLSEEDRSWVNSTTGGYGAMVLRQMAAKKK